MGAAFFKLADWSAQERTAPPVPVVTLYPSVTLRCWISAACKGEASARTNAIPRIRRLVGQFTGWGTKVGRAGEDNCRSVTFGGRPDQPSVIYLCQIAFFIDRPSFTPPPDRWQRLGKMDVALLVSASHDGHRVPSGQRHVVEPGIAMVNAARAWSIHFNNRASGMIWGT